jgi:2-oxo-4-hydroxy-4-carboxy-5-ureidoimidazoline decarboxylase
MTNSDAHSAALGRRARSLDALNDAADDKRLRGDLGACCAAQSWIAAVLASRPYADEEALFAVSDRATEKLDDAGFAEALAAHPRIGDRPIGPEASWSRQEQSGVPSADADTRAQLAVANAEYEQRFGHTYLVCATGKSAEALLEICRSRLGNDPVAERRVVLAELAKISRIRLDKLLHPEVSS